MILAPDQFARLHAHLIGQALGRVDDADAAEDLVQETLITAWQAGAGWSPAVLDRVLADHCRGCQPDRRQDHGQLVEAAGDEPMPCRPATADPIATDAGLDEVELRLTIVEGLRRSAAGELGVAVFALRLAGLRPADVRATLGGSPKAVNDALAMLGRVARRVLGSRPAGDRPPDRPGGRAGAPPPPHGGDPIRRPPLPPAPVPAPDCLLPVPLVLAQTHPIAAALVRAGVPVAASAASSEPRGDEDRRPASHAAPTPAAAMTRAQRRRVQQQERARAVERASRHLEQMRRCRHQAQTAAERATADARLAAAAVRYERARAVLGDLEQRRDALPDTTPDPHARAGQGRRGQC
jgi:DNA-directed RNA polymerase specialized sigma24 family protein